MNIHHSYSFQGFLFLFSSICIFFFSFSLPHLPLDLFWTCLSLNLFVCFFGRSHYWANIMQPSLLGEMFFYRRLFVFLTLPPCPKPLNWELHVANGVHFVQSTFRWACCKSWSKSIKHPLNLGVPLSVNVTLKCSLLYCDGFLFYSSDCARWFSNQVCCFNWFLIVLSGRPVVLTTKLSFAKFYFDKMNTIFYVSLHFSGCLLVSLVTMKEWWNATLIYKRQRRDGPFRKNSFARDLLLWKNPQYAPMSNVKIPALEH